MPFKSVLEIFQFISDVALTFNSSDLASKTARGCNNTHKNKAYFNPSVHFPTFETEESLKEEVVDSESKHTRV